MKILKRSITFLLFVASFSIYAQGISTQIGQIITQPPPELGQFGRSVSLGDLNTIAIGAIDISSGDNAFAYVFELVAGQWVQITLQEPVGIYLLTLYSDDAQHTVRIVKK